MPFRLLLLLLPIAAAIGEETGHPLTDVAVVPPGASDVSFAPAANRSAFRLERGEQFGGLWVAEGTRGDPREVLTDTQEAQYRVLSLSPDGSSLAYAKLTWEVPPSVSAVGILDVATGRKGEFAGTSIAWTPKGDFAAVVDPGGGKVRVVEVASLTAHEVATLPQEGDPFARPPMAWSPDGARLAYPTCEPSAPRVSLWVVSARGGDARCVTSGETCLAIAPFWSPDGRLAWACTEEEGSRLFLEEKDGQAKRIGDETPLQLAGSPAWSPDGKRIVLPRTTVDAEGSRTDLWQIDPATGALARLTQAGDATGELAWSVSGGAVFLSDGTRVRCVPVQGR